MNNFNDHRYTTLIRTPVFLLKLKQDKFHDKIEKQYMDFPVDKNLLTRFFFVLSENWYSTIFFVEDRMSSCFRTMKLDHIISALFHL